MREAVEQYVEREEKREHLRWGGAAGLFACNYKKSYIRNGIRVG